MYDRFLKMKLSRGRRFKSVVLGCLFGGIFIVGAAGAVTPEVTGVLGSPSATTTIGGKQLPPPPDKHFGGKIERNVLQSTPYWCPAPSGASYPRRQWTVLQRRVCATPTSIPRLSARRRGPL